MQKGLLFCTLLFSLLGFSQSKLEVFFDFNKDVPNEVSKIKIAKWIEENKNAEVTILLGYCDSIDDNAYNKELAMRRINSVLELFRKNSIKVSEKVALKSYGEDFNYSKIQSENRKVEVFYNSITDKKAEKSNVKIVNTKKEAPPKKPTESRQIEEKGEFDPVNIEGLVAAEKTTLAEKFEKAKKGDLVRINNINFYLNSEKVTEHSVPLLNELLQIMLNNPKMRIEIHGHICCNPNPMDTKLSYRRALVILKYLTNRGIEVNRLAFKGYGSNDPIYRVPERNEKERAANRRVEILIVAK